MAGKKTSADFWNRVARRYADMALRNPSSFEATLARIRTYLRPDQRVLEIGCGTGTTALLLAPSVNDYTGTDYAAAMIAIARERQAEAKVTNVSFQVAQLDDDALPDSPFDVVLAFNVLHLLADRPAALTGISRRLRPRGLFISKTPCLGGVYRFLQPLVAALRLFGKAPKLDFLTPAAVEQDVVNADFEIVESATYAGRPPSQFIVARKRDL